MSLHHVLDTARKLGIPVVITTQTGEAAQVVMPFDDFAAMVNISSPSGAKSRAARSARTPAPTTIPIRQEDRDDIANAMAELDINHFQEEESPAIPPPIESSKDSLMDEGFLEEKFYLEPLDDEESLKG
jgi:hypothetical protein